MTTEPLAVPQECISCRKPKAILTCGICEEPICKKCAQILGNDAFQFLAEVPEELKHPAYCGACYDDGIGERFEAYEATMEKAKESFVFFKTQRKEIPLIRSARETLTVTNCPDRDEAILRLAFFSAELGFNAVMDVEVSYRQVNDQAFQSYLWSGSGKAAEIDALKLDRQDRQNQIYR